MAERKYYFRITGWLGWAIFIILLGPAQTEAQIGHSVAGVGPINRSMGGAAVAAPIDAAGALYWNPATIGGLGRSEIEFGVEVLMPRSTLSSRVDAGTFGLGRPPTPLGGSTRGNNGLSPVPAFGLVYREEDSPWTYGLGFFEVAGYAVNYPVSRINPVLMPRAPFGGGFGPLHAQYLLYQFAPTVACQLTDHLAVGLAANFDVGFLNVDPALFAAPTLLTTPLGASASYPAATHGRARLGGGFQVGVYYDPGTDWRFGAALKSPQWFETYSYYSTAAAARGDTFGFELDFPLIASLGVAYTGIDRLLLAGDVRLVNFHDTEGFRDTGFDARGSLRGLGWQNIFALAIGGQYQWTDSLSLRAGYTFNPSPAGNRVTAFNVTSPTIVEHSLSAGISYDITKSLKASAAYVHYFENSIEGPLVAPFVGPVPGGSVRTTAAADSFIFGVSVAF